MSRDLSVRPAPVVRARGESQQCGLRLQHLGPVVNVSYGPRADIEGPLKAGMEALHVDELIMMMEDETAP